MLLAATPQAWVELALQRWQDLLIDHANCEKKAASTALSLMFAYPDDRRLAQRLARLAREELRHCAQVERLLQQLRGVVHAKLQGPCDERAVTRNLIVLDSLCCSQHAGFKDLGILDLVHHILGLGQDAIHRFAANATRRNFA